MVTLVKMIHTKICTYITQNCQSTGKTGLANLFLCQWVPDSASLVTNIPEATSRSMSFRDSLPVVSVVARMAGKQQILQIDIYSVKFVNEWYRRATTWHVNGLMI